MRTAEQLLKSAFGDPDLSTFEADDTKDAGRVKFYTATLPREKYVGLPQVWYFGIILEPEKKTRPEEALEALRSARGLIRDALAHARTPLILLSDDPDVKLADNLRLDNKNVFFIDHSKLPGVKNYQTNVRSAPFVRAVREKISRKDLSALFFEPYCPGEPAEGWRFFGRKAELDRIVNTSQSFLVVGSRRIGKTSLLREAQRRLTQAGAQVYFISAQDLATPQQVVDTLARALSPRETHSAMRRHKELNEGLLRSVLHAVSHSHQRVTLIIDELGNVIQKNRQDDWRIMGVFREYAHSSGVQIIMSAFQEFFLKQLQDAEGPFVNLADIIRLGAFSDSEVEEFLVEPLALWTGIRDRKRFRDQVLTRVGRQPFILQHLGRALFQKVFEPGSSDIDYVLEDILSNEMTKTFDVAIDEVFFRLTSATQRYLFLKACHDAEAEGRSVTSVEMTDTWTKEALKSAGYESTFDGRRLVLESLELIGLTAAVGDNRSRQRILTPVIWNVSKALGSPEELIATFAEEIRQHQDRLTIHAHQQ
jgi:hypothetical protein